MGSSFGRFQQFTKPGLTQNVERTGSSPSEVAQLQTWYKALKKSEDISDDILRIIGQHSETWSPLNTLNHLRIVSRSKGI